MRFVSVDVYRSKRKPVGESSQNDTFWGISCKISAKKKKIGIIIIPVQVFYEGLLRHLLCSICSNFASRWHDRLKPGALCCSSFTPSYNTSDRQFTWGDRSRMTVISCDLKPAKNEQRNQFSPPIEDKACILSPFWMPEWSFCVSHSKRKSSFMPTWKTESKIFSQFREFAFI